MRSDTSRLPICSSILGNERDGALGRGIRGHRCMTVVQTSLGARPAAAVPQASEMA